MSSAPAELTRSRRRSNPNCRSLTIRRWRSTTRARWPNLRPSRTCTRSKGDYVFSSRNRVSGLFSRYYSPGIGQVGPVSGIPSPNWGNDIRIRYYRLNHDYVIGPNLLHHFTDGFNQRNVIENP